MKTTLRILLGLLTLALVFPVVNLVVGAPKSALLDAQVSDPAFHAAVDVMAKNCSACHVPGTEKPFYARLPWVEDVIQKDVDKANLAFDFQKSLFPEDGSRPSPSFLEKVESVVKSGDMPPTRYVALHWDAAMTRQDKDTLLTWLGEARRLGSARLPTER